MLSVRKLLILISGIFLASGVWAASLTVGSGSGPAGTSVSLPINFDPAGVSATNIQFQLTLPAGLSTGTVTAGAIITSTGKSLSASLVGNVWNFAIVGINSTPIPQSILLGIQVKIAPGTPVGALNIGVSNAFYSDVNGNAIALTGTGGTVNVTAALPPAPVITVNGGATAQVGVLFNYQINATNSPTSYNATGLPAGLTVDTTSGKISGTPTTAGTSNINLSATNAGGTGTAVLVLTISNPLPGAPVITSAGTAPGTVGSPFNYTITATNNPSS